MYVCMYVRMYSVIRDQKRDPIKPAVKAYIDLLGGRSYVCALTEDIYCPNSHQILAVVTWLQLYTKYIRYSYI